MNRIYAAVRVAALDPYPGFLHAIDYGRYSLVLDLMEEFRPIIADTLTLSLFNLKILKPDDFYVEKPEENAGFDVGNLPIPDVTKDPIGLISGISADTDTFDLPEQRIDSGPPESTGGGKYPVKLSDEAFRRVIEAFEKKLTTEFYYPPAERIITYGEALIHQAGHFRKVIEGEAEVYLPLLLK
jgi:CRISPR-associated protein Cas1